MGKNVLVVIFQEIILKDFLFVLDINKMIFNDECINTLVPIKIQKFLSEKLFLFPFLYIFF